ncbi:MAG: hypothetical protein DI586_10600 [Micavibrio aeruginosavorus]|uniref:DUF4852 domain-containing protein n=1 Tax=Micavibrio aeruginosavorus TaxID=349221 RepID=A0A2W5FEN0_9BACT|nr:MAG: hypothetical protein DI586_10600 [Micavibrio aeruginosavorus]
MIRIFIFSLAVFCLTFTSAKAQSVSGQLLYSPTTPEYLAKSYWLLNGLDVEKIENIDQYLMITECDLYKQYYSNDIEWSKIREATKGYINLNKPNFPRRFEFIQPLYLGRYDTSSKEFEIMKNSQINGILQMYVSGNQALHYECINSGAFKPSLFPINASLKLSRPLTYMSVHTTTDSAREYLKYIDENSAVTDFGRLAYIRYRFKVEQSLTPISNEDGIFANFFGSLESVSVFGDRSMFIKLEEVKF